MSIDLSSLLEKSQLKCQCHHPFNELLENYSKPGGTWMWSSIGALVKMRLRLFDEQWIISPWKVWSLLQLTMQYTLQLHPLPSFQTIFKWIIPVNYCYDYSCIWSHQSFEFLLGESHVLVCCLVVVMQVGVKDQRVICVQRVVSFVFHEPARKKWYENE